MADRDRKNNPKNNESELFNKLTRLLSGPLVDFRKQSPRKLRRHQLNKEKFKSASGQSFKKDTRTPYEAMQAAYMANQNRADRYIDFDQMEYTPEIASAIDIYADEMTTATYLTPLLNIKCANEEIKHVLDTLYHNVLNINFNLFGWCRTMCKYGDFFLYLDIDDSEGVKYVTGIPPNQMERLEGEDKTNPNYIQFQWNDAGMTFENWQVAHFRVLGNDKYAPYGTSILEPARRIWRQLTLIEDAMMAYRIVRSPERRVFYIDVGSINPSDVESYMQKVLTQMKRNQIVDPDTGRVDLRYNPMSVEEDYYIPVRGGQSSRIETLPGGTYTGDIDDVKYLRDKLFSALKVPASYLARGDGADEDKTTLSQKDIRFARTIQRLQRAIISELEKVGIVHLFTLGYRGSDLLSFTLNLNNPSRLAELQELEHWKTKFDIASSATEGFFSKRWVAENLFNLPDDEMVRIQREMFHDRKFEAALEMSIEGAAGEEDLGDGGLGGGLDLGGEALPADVADEALAAEDPAAEDPMEPPEEGDLLATPPGTEALPPAKRDENMTISKKGKPHHKGPNHHRAGRRRLNMRSEASISSDQRGSTKRSTVGQLSPDLGEQDQARFGIYEGLDSTYKKEEENIFAMNREIKKLIDQLEEKEK
jgi:hypothetical protein